MAERRYDLSKLRAALQEPTLFASEAERIVSKQIFKHNYGSGIDVMAAEWDTLVILDACRADYFARYNRIDGDLHRVVSQGSHSQEFIDANFAGRELHDTILITANPFVEKLSGDVFFRVCYADLFDQWDESLKTIPPEAVVEATVRMHERYPDKRLIAHFMQPHAPYIGPTGKDLAKRRKFGVFNPDVREREEFDVPKVGLSQAVVSGPIREDELKQAYAENVQIALTHAEELIEQLDGKSVITADHGEMLGERVLVSTQYGHSGHTYTPELRVVPWLVIDSDTRRNVTEGEPAGFTRLDDELRQSRLHALGYA